ncbi:MAG TPA: serine protease, partial [Puia sp.]
TGRYINSTADAFELASTLRQFQEVWRLTMDDRVGSQILPLLNAALLKREGATLTIPKPDLEKQAAADTGYSLRLERVLGADSFKTYQWYLRGLKACSAVARIGRDSSKGFGTGFLLDGGQLSEALRGKMVLFTNSHIISNDPATNNSSLYPDQAVATLEALDQTIQLRFDRIIFNSSLYELDTTILTFDPPSEEKLIAIREHIYSYSLAKRLPAADQKQRIYIIGHPSGGALQVSLQDNILLAHNDRLMHYRTPTEGGSSGSPVFNDEWELIGIHHGGSDRVRPLDGSGIPYAANEGISLAAIKALFAQQEPAALVEIG